MAPNLDELSKSALSVLEQGRNNDAVGLFSEILSHDPVHQFALWNRAIAFMRQGNLDAALVDLYTLLKENPRNLEARNQIRFIHRKLVGSWHFDMMNDVERNNAYQRAIENIVTPETVVFEIGTGSGLLSMLAARAGAKHVYTCEKVMPIRRAAREIIRKNGFQDKITILDKWSTSVRVPEDIPHKVDVVLGEIFGPGLLEEQALHFFEDARARILKPGGKMIPARATMFTALFESEELFRRAVVGTVCGFDLSLFNGLHDDPVVDLPFARFDHQLLSATTVIKKIDFTNASSGTSEESLAIEVQKTGTCHGAVQWFQIETDNSNSIDSSPHKTRTHWDQHIQVFEKPFSVTAGQKLQFLVRQFSDRFSLHRTS